MVDSKKKIELNENPYILAWHMQISAYKLVACDFFQQLVAAYPLGGVDCMLISCISKAIS